MENQIMNDERWVNARLRTLDPGADWRPNAGAGLARLQRRERMRRGWRRGGIWSMAAAAAGLVVILALPVPAKCALVGMGCPRPGVLLAPAAAMQASAPAGAATKKAAVRATSKAQTNFKESGSPSAPITIELYTDYQCPACREFYLTRLPQLTTDFINAGKVRLIHRDFPLPQHTFAKLATRYANAAGQIGKYDVVASQLFETQPDWEVNGDIDSAVAKVLSPAQMAEVRNIVKTDSALDESMVNDQNKGTFQDHVEETPSIVIVYKGQRETIGGAMPYDLLKQYLNKKLSQ
jgi:protein-disulfide isomerase